MTLSGFKRLAGFESGLSHPNRRNGRWVARNVAMIPLKTRKVHLMAQRIAENLEDHDTCAGIVLSLRTYLSMLDSTHDNYRRHVDNITRIAYALDDGTCAFIEARKNE